MEPLTWAASDCHLNPGPGDNQSFPELGRNCAEEWVDLILFAPSDGNIISPPEQHFHYPPSAWETVLCCLVAIFFFSHSFCCHFSDLLILSVAIATRSLAASPKDGTRGPLSTVQTNLIKYFTLKRHVRSDDFGWVELNKSVNTRQVEDTFWVHVLFNSLRHPNGAGSPLSRKPV